MSTHNIKLSASSSVAPSRDASDLVACHRGAVITIPREEYLSSRQFSSLKRAYLTPFSDYPTNLFTEHFSLQEIAAFAAGYAAGHITRSDIIALLTGHRDMIIENMHRIQLMRNQVAKGDVSEQFIAYTQLAAEERVGNCGERAYVTARALKEFGFRGRVTVIIITGYTSSDHSVNHCLVKIAAPEGPQAVYVDPFIYALGADCRKRLNIPEESISWPARTTDNDLIRDHLYVTVQKQQGDKLLVNLLSCQEISDMCVRDGAPAELKFSYFDVEKDADNKIVVKYHDPTQPPKVHIWTAD